VKHVAYLIPTLDRIGGAEQQVILLASGLAKRGWRVSVITLSGTGGDAKERLQSTGIDFLSLHMRKGLADPRGWIRLNRWIKVNHPDVVHAHLPHASLLARWSRIASPVRVLVDTIHSPATGGTACKFGYRMSAGLPDAVTAVSQAASETWLTSGMVNEEKLATIPNGVDLDHWKSDRKARDAMRQELCLSDEFLWLAVGRLDLVKDHATLLRAFSRLSSNARLVIAGEGPLKSQLNSLVKALALGDRVSFPGFQIDVLRWMRAADAFVLSSRWEGLPMAMLEACACELPAVTTDIAGAREVLFEALCIPAAAVGDADLLAASMNAVMCLPEMDRSNLGCRMRQSVVERFSLDIVLNKWEDLYRALLAQNPQPSRFGRDGLALDRTLQLQ
jgi:glycosyltransferase involved in cell wall biosynthesis